MPLGVGNGIEAQPPLAAPTKVASATIGPRDVYRRHDLEQRRRALVEARRLERGEDLTD